MAGIALLQCARPLVPEDEAALRRALGAAPHRGSDYCVARVGTAVLGLARTGMADEEALFASDGECALVGAGWLNLDELAPPGGAVAAPGRMDPAVERGARLLALWRQHGPALPRLLRGTFAIAISDGRTATAFRDHLGGATLFLREESVRTLVASEAKQVAAGAGLRRRPDFDTLQQVFYGGEDDAMGTALSGVDRLPKATVLETDGSGSRRRRYWEPEALLEQGGVPREELRERFDALATRAVARSLRGRDALALSGGIDSPTIAAFAAPLHRERFGRPLTAFSMVFPDYPACDESRYIHAVSGRLGLTLHAYQPDPAMQRLDRLAAWVGLLDGPWSGAWSPGMDLDRYARIRALGATNLLTGDFAEYASDFRFHLLTHLVAHARFRAALRQAQAQRRRGVATSHVMRQIVASIVPGAVIRAVRQRRPRFPTPSWVDARRVLRAVTSEVVSPRTRWRRQQLAAFIGPGITLEAHHLLQHAAGVRVTNPWGDIDLWELFLGMRAEDKFPGAQPKQLVRSFMRGRLPEVVLNRRDKTVLDAFVAAGTDYPTLRTWLTDPGWGMPGVDYRRLAGHLEREDLDIFGYLWAKDLAGVHAFIATT